MIDLPYKNLIIEHQLDFKKIRKKIIYFLIT